MACRPQKSSLVRQSRQHGRPILSRTEAGVREIHAELRLFVRSEDALHQRTGTAFRQIPENSRRVQGGTGGCTVDFARMSPDKISAGAQSSAFGSRHATRNSATTRMKIKKKCLRVLEGFLRVLEGLKRLNTFCRV